MPNSQEWEGRRVASVRTEEMLKPGENGMGFDEGCGWYVDADAPWWKRRVVSSRYRFDTIWIVIGIVFVKTGGRG